MGDNAADSQKVEKARKKLEKQFKKEEAMITQKNIQRAIDAIHIRQERLKDSHIKLKNRKIIRNPEETKSQRVHQMFKELKALGLKQSK